MTPGKEHQGMVTPAGRPGRALTVARRAACLCPRSNYEHFNCSIFYIRAGITAAVGNILDIQSILAQGSKVCPFQLREYARPASRHLTDQLTTRLGELLRCARGGIFTATAASELPRTTFDWSPPGFGRKTAPSWQDTSRLSVSRARNPRQTASVSGPTTSSSTSPRTRRRGQACGFLPLAGCECGRDRLILAFSKGFARASGPAEFGVLPGLARAAVRAPDVPSCEHRPATFGNCLLGDHC
ncbi:hypothetical protein DPMN_054605 [Dreissena polymorpha]|uniref:Uncharacterized protein n=1 Tax=Dreissena polymorpha TaxID=45954 RepID=A0A9D4CR07_DREPO|nr:hypothetical protein DPMN_054605 [Dreissena polymorpha]